MVKRLANQAYRTPSTDMSQILSAPQEKDDRIASLAAYDFANDFAAAANDVELPPQERTGLC
jgi:hypothetical protein